MGLGRAAKAPRPLPITPKFPPELLRQGKIKRPPLSLAVQSEALSSQKLEPFGDQLIIRDPPVFCVSVTLSLLLASAELSKLGSPKMAARSRGSASKERLKAPGALVVKLKMKLVVDCISELALAVVPPETKLASETVLVELGVKVTSVAEGVIESEFDQLLVEEGPTKVKTFAGRAGAPMLTVGPSSTGAGDAPQLFPTPPGPGKPLQVAVLELITPFSMAVLVVLKLKLVIVAPGLRVMIRLLTSVTDPA